ncbi:MAG: helix-turn-helix transcriptional regulator [Paramuribaculum intestinale]|uniref:S24 family peptidase n=1 Tax=Paramuribaculum intestinale TaxID=2094151 RepID=UPI001A1DF63E|nr:helix-turn-helix transcriptional regulator [Muribaculaceae bacterium]MCX4329217.1 helix-turn-helix transcriptional regulator [Paramuribaculum intestinale]
MSKIIDSLTQVNPTWLLTGRGDMLQQAQGADGDPSRVSKDFDAGPIDRANPGATRPRIPFTAAAGALSIATNAACDADCERFPVITTFPAYDFTIKIEGDSMAPDYLSGDELACRFVDYPANIKWGEPHILDTRDGVVFKIPYFGGDQIMCRSINPDGPSFLVDCADVLHVASIVGFTRQLQP